MATGSLNPIGTDRVRTHNIRYLNHIVALRFCPSSLDKRIDGVDKRI